MQYNGQNNDEFKYRWNYYEDNNGKSLRGEDRKQAGIFGHFKAAGYSDFINDTEIRIKKLMRLIPLTLKDVRIFG